MKKRIIAALLTVLLGLCLLSGCETQKAESAEAASEVPAAELQ